MLAILIALGATGRASAQTTLDGSLGVDLGSFGFGNKIIATSQEFGVRRSLSNQFLRLRLSGPLISNQFAGYVLRGTVSGTYYEANSETGEADEYIRPNLSDYLVSISEDDAAKAGILAAELESIRTTIYRQTLFSEFERVVHGYVEEGTPITATLRG